MCYTRAWYLFGRDSPDQNSTATQPDDSSPNPPQPSGLSLEWDYNLDVPEAITDTVAHSTGIVLQTSSGLVGKVNSSGEEQWLVNLDTTLIQGLDTNNDTVAINCEDKVLLLDIESGEIISEISRQGDDGPQPSIALGNDFVIIGHDSDSSSYEDQYNVTGYRIDSGETLWQVEAPFEDMVLIQDTLYLDGANYIESPGASGEVNIQSITNAIDRTTKIVTAGEIGYYGLYDRDDSRIVAIDLSRNAIVWEQDVGEGISGFEPLIGFEDTVMINLGWRVVGLTNGGDMKYETTISDGDGPTTVRTLNDTAFLISDKILYGITIMDGTITHEQQLEKSYSTIETLDDKIVASTDDGTIEAYEPE